jgi:hypothetical protein
LEFKENKCRKEFNLVKASVKLTVNWVDEGTGGMVFAVDGSLENVPGRESKVEDVGLCKEIEKLASWFKIGAEGQERSAEGIKFGGGNRGIDVELGG